MSATVASVYKLPHSIRGARLRADGWARCAIAIRTKEGTKVVKGFEHADAPGLAYHRMYGVRDIAFVTTHKKSGLICGPVTLSHGEARAVHGDLAVGRDWDQPEAVVAKTPEYCERSRYVALIYCDCPFPPWLPKDAEEDHL